MRGNRGHHLETLIGTEALAVELAIQFAEMAGHQFSGIDISYREPRKVEGVAFFKVDHETFNGFGGHLGSPSCAVLHSTA